MSDEGLHEAKYEEVKQDFIKITGVQPAESPKASEIKENAEQTAGNVLAALEKIGVLDQSQSEKVLQMWQNAIPLDKAGMKSFTDHLTEPFKLAAKTLAESDPNGTNEEVQALIRKFILINQIDDTIGESGYACVYRHDPIFSQSRPDLQNLQSTEFVVLNTENIAAAANPDLMVRAIGVEETLHLVSRLQDYDGLKKKWTEEMMARMVEFALPEGFAALPEVDRASLKKDLRADDYMALYKAVSNMIGDDKVMFAAFFGKLPKDSEQAQKAKQAVASLDMVGEMIDMGTSVADIQKMAKP